MIVFNDVLNFAEACDQEPSEEMQALYMNLVREEFEELEEAVAAKDEVEILDACMDLLWVTIGLCHMKGYDLYGAWDELTENNFSKIDPVTGKVVRREDGKILKPASWTAPDFAPYLPTKI